MIRDGNPEIGVTAFRLFLTLWHVMLRHNFTLDSCMRFRIWQPANLKRAASYVQHGELVRILRWLNKGQDTKAIDNKILFGHMCLSKGFPEAGCVAIVTMEKVQFNSGNSLPTCDLFLKFNNRWGGSGGQIWRYNGKDNTWQHGDTELHEPKLLKYLQTRAAGAEIIVQRRLTNGSQLARFSSGGLCTFRVVTRKTPEKDAYVMFAGLRMPTGAMDVDNFSSGGLISSLTSAGQLSQAIAGEGAYVPYDCHPNTNEKITGSMICCWPEIYNTALRAHNQLTDLYAVGWDIAWTEDGPVLIEGNTGWGEFQMTDCTPWGPEISQLVALKNSKSV